MRAEPQSDEHKTRVGVICTDVTRLRRTRCPLASRCFQWGGGKRPIRSSADAPPLAVGSFEGDTLGQFMRKVDTDDLPP
jgi:hypothetical protein